MINVIIHVSKYILAILAASYAMKCFTVFSDRHAYDRGGVYLMQNFLMFLIHFICYAIIYLMTDDIKMLYFYTVILTQNIFKVNLKQKIFVPNQFNKTQKKKPYRF